MSSRLVGIGCALLHGGAGKRLRGGLAMPLLLVLGVSTGPQASALERIGAIELAGDEDVLSSAVIDPAGAFAYFGTINVPGLVVKIDLETFERVDALTLEDGEDSAVSAVIDPAGAFAYFGTLTAPGRVVKIDLGTFERVGALTLEDGEDFLVSAVIDPTGAFAYFGTDTSPGRVVRIDLETFERVDAITLASGENGLRSAVIDPMGALAYFSTLTAPGRVVKIDLGTFERVGAIPLESGEEDPNSAVIDPTGAFAYFGTDTFPGRVVQIGLETFERVGAITLGSGEDRLFSAVIDPTGAFAYFGTLTDPGRVVQIDLETFERVDAITLESGENGLFSAVIDPAGEFAYFGTDTFPGRVVKVAVAPPAAPLLTFAPTELDFDDIEVGTTSPPQTATLANTGTVDLTGISFASPGAGFTADTSACGSALPLGEECQISVTFTPPELGELEAQLAVSSNEGATAVLDLAGAGIEVAAPIVDLSPESFSFELPTGGAESQTLTLANLGDATLDWEIREAVDCDAEPGIIVHDDGTVEVGYSGDPDFGVTEVRFVDKFTPSSYPAAFRAVCLAFVSSSLEEPTSFDFDVVVFDDDGEGDTPGTELGSLPVSVTVDPDDDFSVPMWLSFDISSFGLSIDSGSVYIGARWVSPNVEHLFIAADQSPGNPPGFAGGYIWLDTSGEWSSLDDGEYRSLMVRAVEGAGLVCDNSTEIPWLSSDPSAGSTPPGESSEVAVTIDASDLAPGDYQGSLCVASNDPVNPLVVVPVNLTVTGAAELTFEPASLDFGDVEIGATSSPQTATLANIGNAAATGLDFSDLSGSGFVAEPSACGDILPAGGGCEMVVTFTPDLVGEYFAALDVTSAGGSATSLSLAGFGLGEELIPMGLTVDGIPLLSDANLVFEPGECVEVAPAWLWFGSFNAFLEGDAQNFTGPEGPAYDLILDGASYGGVSPGEIADCRTTGLCYQVQIGPSGVTRPAVHWDATLAESLFNSDFGGGGGEPQTWALHLGESFADVPRSSPFYRSIETLLHNGVTGGCTDSEYCPAGTSNRGQMPVFMLKALEGAEYVPPACDADEGVFADVPAASPFCRWIEELANRGVVAGCGGGNYCPGDPVTRAQMAVLLLRTLEGASYTPPPCQGLFTDVTCPSAFAAWIEELYNREIISGCGAEPLAYCPATLVSRAQMAVFVTRTFGLALYGP